MVIDENEEMGTVWVCKQMCMCSLASMRLSLLCQIIAALVYDQSKKGGIHDI